MRLVNHTAICLRGMLSAAIYNKGLNLDEDQLSNDEVVTLLNSDMNAISTAVTSLHDIWASALEVAVGLYLLYMPIGAHLIWVLTPVAISLYLAPQLGKPTMAAQTKWHRKLRERVSATSAMLKQLTSIRASGLTLVFLDYLENLQNVEVKASSSDRYLRIASRVIGELPRQAQVLFDITNLVHQLRFPKA